MTGRHYSFFFQAEDGIRDLTVTGVQTCALPICSRSTTGWCATTGAGRSAARGWWWRLATSPAGPTPGSAPYGRSEERRVGKECRSGGSPDQYITKTASGKWPDGAQSDPAMHTAW